MNDLDICFDYRMGNSIKNTRRVETDIENLNEFIGEISTKYSCYNFFIIPSFPSIEYAIALGLDSSIENISCTNSILKEDVFLYFDNVNGSHVSRNKKKFNNLFYSNNIFKFENLNNNSIKDRSNKNISSDIRGFMTEVSKGVETIVNNNQPFTYLDQITMLIQEFLAFHL